jgi:hypothetical protein
MKAVVVEDRRAHDGPLLENPEFARFAAHWGFRIRACRPYRAKTKGKVERPIRYVRQSFFYGRTFLNDADLNAQALQWMTRVANERRHRTTGEQPRVRFNRDEGAKLQPLAARPYTPLVPPVASVQQRAAVALPVVERRPLSVYSVLAGTEA